MTKAKGGPSGSQSPETVPTKFAETTPLVQTSSDMTAWLLNAITKNTEAVGRMDGALTGLQAQLTRVEVKLTEVEKEVAGHGKWMHTLKVFAGVVGALLIWAFVNAAWPVIKQKLNIP